MKDKRKKKTEGVTFRIPTNTLGELRQESDKKQESQFAQVPGISYDGGYADYMIAPTEVITSIHDELSAAEAAPMMYAGITRYNALRNSGACIGDVIAIFGVGGLDI